MIKIAIPQFGDAISPRFEVARHFTVATIAGDRVTSAKVVECTGPEDYRRVRLLQIHQVSVLICNGIKGSCRDMLSATGVTVIPNISSTVQDALDRFLACELVAEDRTGDDTSDLCAIPHKDLVRRARSLFEKHGFEVGPGPAQQSFLIDLVAKTNCPLCGKPVKVAVCCGAHTYRKNQEITEFHHATPSGYNARVYVCPDRPSLAEYCQEYGIELIDPDHEDSPRGDQVENKIPLLRGPVLDHEKASQHAQSKQ